MELAAAIGFAALVAAGVLTYARLDNWKRLQQELDNQRQEDFYHIALSEIPAEGHWQEPQMPKPPRDPEDEIVSCTMQNGETFLYIYNESTRCDMMRHLGHCAADPTHPLTWLDVANLTRLMREAAIERQWAQAEGGE